MIKYYIFFSFILVCISLAILYQKFGLFKTFYHDVLKWHEPIGNWEFDGCNVHSVCKHCGKEIMRDSQGNWFGFNERRSDG